MFLVDVLGMVKCDFGVCNDYVWVVRGYRLFGHDEGNEFCYVDGCVSCAISWGEVMESGH